MTIKKLMLLSFFLLLVFLNEQLKSNFFLFKFFQSYAQIAETGENDFLLSDAINTILKHAPEGNYRVLQDSINKIFRKKYNYSLRRIVIKISSLIKTGNLDYLCDENQVNILIGIPPFVSNSELLDDIELYKLKKLIKNIINYLVVCIPKNPKKKIYFESDGCQSESDQEIIFDDKKYAKRGSLKLQPRNKFFSTLLKCSVDSLGSGDKTMECVKKKLSKDNLKLSESCSNCFKKSVECGRSNCWLPCLFSNPCGDSCFHCGVNNCKKELIRCTGLENLPDACI